MQKIKDLLLSRGAVLVGFADLAEVPAEPRGGFPRAVSIAAALDPEIVAGITGGPTLKYREHYRDKNAELDALAAEAERFLLEKGHRASRAPATNPEQKKHA